MSNKPHRYLHTSKLVRTHLSQYFKYINMMFFTEVCITVFGFKVKIHPTMGTFGRLTAFILLVTALTCIQSSSGARCPPPSWIKQTKICISDKECYPGLCCPNYQGRKSCALSQSGNGHGTFKKDATRITCDGVKCMPYEVCKTDPITKRRRCQRA